MDPEPRRDEAGFEADVALVTCAPFPELAASEHGLLAAALEARGLRARTVAWDAPEVDFGRFPLSVVRTTWDYVPRREAFLAWADATPRLHNPAPVLRWNSHKGYLRDLERAGVPIVPTRWVEAGVAPEDAGALLFGDGWDEVVVKPAVSAGARGTRRFRRSEGAEATAWLLQLSAVGDVLIQPYLPAVDDPRRGERSLVFIDGVLSHEVRRSAFLTSGSHEAEPLAAEDDDVAFAQRVLRAAPQGLLYARVDQVRDGEGRLCLMELELIEPSLFLSVAPEAAHRFAAAIETRLRSSPTPTYEPERADA